MKSLNSKSSAQRMTHQARLYTVARQTFDNSQAGRKQDIYPTMRASLRNSQYVKAYVKTIQLAHILREG